MTLLPPTGEIWIYFRFLASAQSSPILPHLGNEIVAQRFLSVCLSAFQTYVKKKNLESKVELKGKFTFL